MAGVLNTSLKFLWKPLLKIHLIQKFWKVSTSNEILFCTFGKNSKSLATCHLAGGGWGGGIKLTPAATLAERGGGANLNGGITSAAKLKLMLQLTVSLTSLYILKENCMDGNLPKKIKIKFTEQ